MPIQKFREARAAAAAEGFDVFIACPQSQVDWVKALMRREGANAYVSGFQTDAEVPHLLHDLAASTEIVAIAPLSERVVVPVALVCEGLGLRGPGAVAAQLSRRKDLQRQMLARWQLPYTRTVVNGILDVWPAQADFPVIVKPVDASGSFGILLARGAQELGLILESTHGNMVVESFIDGEEFSVEAIVSSGSPLAMAVARKQTNSGFVEIGQFVGIGATSTDEEQALLTAARHLVDDAQIEDAFVHAEFLLPPGQPPVLVEFACRPPGDALMLLHSLVAGYDLGTRWIAELTGNAMASPRRSRDTLGAAGQKYLIHRDAGRFSGVEARSVVDTVYLADGDLWPTRTDLGAGNGAVCLAHHPRGSLIGEVSSSFTRAASVVTAAATLGEVRNQLDEMATFLDPIILRTEPSTGTPTSANGPRQT